MLHPNEAQWFSTSSSHAPTAYLHQVARIVAYLVVLGAVAEDELDVGEEVLDALVVMRMAPSQPLLHRAHVHRLLDDLKVVRHLYVHVATRTQRKSSPLS